ncbi:MAG: ABC transporter substrate-binding protein [Acidimicrobiales bacterium]
MHRSDTRRRGALAALGLCCCALLVSGTAADGAPRAPARKHSPPVSAATGVTFHGISNAECAANHRAGTIVFVTSYSYAPAASIADVVVAARRGYFKDMCLHVVLQAGFSTDNVALVSADRVQISSLGSDSEVLAARAEGAHLEGILTYGHTAVSELLTPGNVKITNLRQLDGQTIGIKGALPYEVEAMLAKAGVNIASLHLVQVPYNPVIIDQGRIMGLPVYKSNEVRELNELGYKYEVWDPTKYGVAASFASLVANTDFVRAHPTAVADFLRADLAGFWWAYRHKDQAVAYCDDLVPPQLDITRPVGRFRWRVESGLVIHSTPPGEPIGAIDFRLVAAEYAQDVRLHLVPAGVDIHHAFDATFASEIYEGTTLVWPTRFN